MLRALFWVLSLSLLFSCALGPPVYWGLEYLFDGLRWPYSRVFDRVFLAALLLLLFFYRKQLSIVDVKSDFPALSKTQVLQHVALGLLLTGVSLMVVFPLVVAGGDLIWSDRGWEFYRYRIPKALIGGLVVSVLDSVLLCGTKRGFVRCLQYELREIGPLIRRVRRI